jgi:hypothetical protein
MCKILLVYTLLNAVSHLYAPSTYLVQSKKKEQGKKGRKQRKKEYQTQIPWKFDHKCQNIILVLKKISHSKCGLMEHRVGLHNTRGPLHYFHSSSWLLYRLISGAFAKLKSDCLSVSVCLHGTTQLPLDGFSWNLIFKYISKMSKNSCFNKIWQE